MASIAPADLPAATRWTNWVANQSFTPAYAAAPRDEDEVVALVRAAAERGMGVRVAAAGHSFTPVVETDGMVLDLSAMRGVVATDAARRRASALPGTLIRDFYEPLWDAAPEAGARPAAAGPPGPATPVFQAPAGAPGPPPRNQGQHRPPPIAGAVPAAHARSGPRFPDPVGGGPGVRLVTATGEIREI